jgi:hypothetical protein
MSKNLIISSAAPAALFPSSPALQAIARRVSLMRQIALAVMLGDAAKIVEGYRGQAPSGFDVFNTKSNSWENGVLDHLFTNAAVANVGDAVGLRGSTTAGSLYVSLHTADPGEAGDQTTSEATYTSYARVAVARTSGGWTVSGNQVQNAAAITFPAATGGTNTLTYFGIGTASSGAGVLIYSGALTPSLAVSNGITPQINASQITITED